MTLANLPVLANYSYITSRSRIEQSNNCERSRWLGHEYLGRGLELNRVNLPMSIGAHTHKGVELVMIARGMQGKSEISIEVESPPPPDRPGEALTIKLSGLVEDVAVELALMGYDEQVRERNFDVSELGDSLGEEATRFVYEESRAMIEGLVRTFNLVAMPQLLERYEVVEVEHDAVVPLQQGPLITGHSITTFEDGEEHCRYCEKLFQDIAEEYEEGIGCPHGQIGFRFIPDALLRERTTGDLYVFSLKTAKEWDQRTEEAARYDQQGVSEVWGTTTRLRELFAHHGDKWDESKFGFDSDVKIMGVQMCYLLKGQRTKAKANDNVAPEGVYFHKSPLLHPYRQMGAMPDDDKFADSVYWECLEPHDASYSYTNNKGKLVKVNKQCDGGAKHKRSGDWVRCNTWSLGDGVKGWIDRLNQPGGVSDDLDYALEKACVMPEPYYRGEQEVEDWFEQASTSESERAQASREANLVLEERGPASQELRQVLNRLYKQDRSRCVWGGRCEFISVCHENVSDPLGSGVYQLRKGKSSEEVEVL